MWIPKSVLAQRLVMVVNDGLTLDSQHFSEEEILEEGEDIACSPLFGEFLKLLLTRWDDLDDQAAVTRAICLGFRRNTFRDAVIEAVDVLVDAELNELASFARALDARASDELTPLAIRVEAVAGLTRLALQAPKFTTYATSGVLRLLEVEDDWVKAKICRIVSILHDQLAWTDAVESLRQLTQCEACAVESRQELGFVEMANAFRSEDVATMSAHFAQSAFWFNDSVRISEDAPRARMYGAVALVLARSLSAQDGESINFQSLSEDAQWIVHYTQPRTNALWLAAPPEAELDWLPLIVQLSTSVGEARLALFARAVQLFEKVRSVRVRTKGQVQFLPPQGFSSLTEQNRLLGTLQRMLHSPSSRELSVAGQVRLDEKLSKFEDLSWVKAENAALQSSDLLDYLLADQSKADREVIIGFREGCALARIPLSIIEKEMVDHVLAKLQGAQDYKGIVKGWFDLLVVRLCKFLCLRNDIGVVKGRYAYLQRTNDRSVLPQEFELQLDLLDFLRGSLDGVHIEVPHVSSGRTDIYIGFEGFRFVIEVKRSTTVRWSTFSIRPHLRQAAAYSSSDVRLGVLATLDLSVRDPGDPHVTSCLGVVRRHASKNDERTVVFMRVAGNRLSPSTFSK